MLDFGDIMVLKKEVSNPKGLTGREAKRERRGVGEGRERVVCVQESEPLLQELEYMEKTLTH